MPGGSANQQLYATKTAVKTKTLLASGLTINTNTLVFTAGSQGSIVQDVLLRNTDTSNARLFDVLVNGTTSTDNIGQISIPANAGNNGTVALASLKALLPQLYKFDANGNLILALESGQTIHLQNKAALTADIRVLVLSEDF